MEISIYTTQYRPLLQLGFPIIIGQIGAIVLNFADTLMIGHHTTEELAAAAFVSNIFILGLLVAMGFAYGLTPVIGSLFGKGDRKGIGVTLRNGLAVNSVVATMLMVIYTIFYFFLDRLGQPEKLVPLMRPYYIVNLISVPFVCWFNALKQFFDATTATRTPMWVLLGGNALNILGNWLLIYGVGIFPELGLLGAGLSTLASRIFMFIILTAIVLTSRRYNEERQGFMDSRVNSRGFSRLWNMGLPLGLQMGMESGAWSLCSIIVGWIGTDALAGHQIMLTISQLFFQIYYGLAAAVSIRTSLFCGQKDYERIVPTAWAGFQLSMIVAVIIAVPVMVLRGSIGYLFTDSADVAAIVAATIAPLIVYQVGDGLQCTFANALRGLGDVRPMMLVAFVSFFVVSLPLSYTLGIVLGGGLEGVWWAFPFGLTLAGCLYHFFFKRRLRIMEKAIDRQGQRIK